MKRLLPILLCFLALAVPRLYGQEHTVKFSSLPAEGGTVTASYFGEDLKYHSIESGKQVKESLWLKFTATANPGYELEKWIVDGEEEPINEDSPKELDRNVSADLTVTAVFKQKTASPTKVKLTYGAATAGGKLSAMVFPAAGGDPAQGTSGSDVDYKATVNFQAEADPDYKVEKWTINGEVSNFAGSENMLTLTLETDTDVQVYFKKNKETADGYVVTYVADPVDGGTIKATNATTDKEIASGSSVAESTSLKFTATANEGYEFEKWTVNGADTPGSFVDPTELSLDITGKTSVVAHFKAPKKYAVTFAAEPAGYGTLTATRYDRGSEKEIPFNSGDEIETGIWVTFNAKPGADYKVEKWIVNDEEIEMPSDPKEHAIELDGALDVKVVFTTKPNEVTLKYSVAAEPAGAGEIAVAVTPKGGGAATSPASDSKVARGSSVTFTAKPATGYEVEKWLVDGTQDRKAGQSTTLTMTLDKDTEVQLFFQKEAKKCTVNFTSEPTKGGTINATGYVNGVYKVFKTGETVPEGSSIDFLAEANEGYEFEKFTLNGKDATPDFANPNKLALEVTGETNVVAHFKSVDSKITITYTAGANGKFTTVKLQKEGQDDVIIKSGTEVDRGSYIVFNVMPDKGYIVDKWTVNGDEVHSREVNSYDASFDETSEVKVTFRKPKLTIATAEGGKIVALVNGTEVPDVTDVALGANVSIEAKPNPGYELTALTANDKDILVAKSFRMKGDTKVVATFTKKANVANYKVTLKYNKEHGTISIKEKVDLNAVPEGTKLTVVAKGANDKCELTKLTANGEDILKDKTFTVAKDTEVIAEFVDHTGIDAVAADAFVIYPNPASESATITGLAPEVAVALYTLDGQLITRLAADRSGRLQIDLTALSEGTYLVVTEGAAQRLVVKH